MSWLYETAWPGLFVCLLAEVVLGIMLLRTGRGQLLFAMLAVAVLGIVLICIEHFVVTEREEVENTLDDLAAALRANSAQQVVGFISPSNQGLRSFATQQLKRVKISFAKVTGDLTIDVSHRQEPPTAKANFIARIEGQELRGHAPRGAFVNRFDVQFRKEGGRWLITGYMLEDFARPQPKKGPPGAPLPSPLPGI